ncbi:MAG: hypothetical protein L7S64_12005, partial [Longimicrobiales bacterium]|nr:hypothetical protein [Longimicrobiales bacterium]
MIRIKWPVALATLFVMLLGSYLLYTQQIFRRVQENSELLSRIYTEVQEGLVSQDQAEVTQSLLELQQIVTQSGVPLVVMGPGDTVLNHVNLPFDVDDRTVEGQERIRAYVRRLDEEHDPVGDPLGAQHIHFGDSPEARSLRSVPYLQAAGLLLTAFIGFLVVRYQR